MVQTNELFPSIGSVADRAESFPETREPTTVNEPADESEDRAVQEIESLCMKCHEQVSNLKMSSVELMI